MGEVKRYDRFAYSMEERRDGDYVEYRDYARLERERDELKLQLAEMDESLAATLSALKKESEAAKAELTRLRAVEAAANAALDALDGAYAFWAISECRALAEACGRKR